MVGVPPHLASRLSNLTLSPLPLISVSWTEGGVSGHQSLLGSDLLTCKWDKKKRNKKNPYPTAQSFSQICFGNAVLGLVSQGPKPLATSCLFLSWWRSDPPSRACVPTCVLFTQAQEGSAWHPGTWGRVGTPAHGAVLGQADLPGPREQGSGSAPAAGSGH